MLTVPYFPHEDSKLRATSRKTRLGGNIPNTLGVLSQILIGEKEEPTKNRKLFFMGALGDDESSVYVLFFSFPTKILIHPTQSSLMKLENKIFETRVGKRTHQTMHLE